MIGVFLCVRHRERKLAKEEEREKAMRSYVLVGYMGPVEVSLSYNNM